MEASLKTRNERREGGCGWWRQHGVQVFICSLLLPNCFRCSPGSPDCRQPCENAICPSTPSPCTHGTYELCNGCCTACAAGPNELCHSYAPIFPPCGDGMTCAGETRHFPGVCEWLPAPSPSPSPSPTPTSTIAVTTASVTPTTTSSLTEVTPTPEPPTEDCSGSDMSAECRPACSVDYCSETDTRKKRICSATGLSPVIPERNECLHTSCGACFLLREPDCSRFLCPEPPTKDCLRGFLTCVRDHYFGPSVASNFIPLEDPRAQTTRGRVVCLVPTVDQHTHGSSSEDGST